MKFGIEEVPPSGPWLAKALELITRHEVTFYDATYHSLAIPCDRSRQCIRHGRREV